ncbi:MAG: TonB-dependent receptor [Cytophagaceae bacterium]|nr:TonB-dependent receptor [Cytophagaceae bacterium]
MKLLLPLLLFTCYCVHAQDNAIDSTQVNELDDVVITGQINKQHVDKSVFEVKVIKRETMDNLAANTLADVLNQSLNITIQPNPSTGKSSVQLFGLDGQYFKILVDNIPLINDEGLGNNTDLTQINLDDIEQIEIVEGSMGVQYGSNAVTGIINIITKKSSRYDWEIKPYIQEETLGTEYGFFDQGRHIQSIKIAHDINEHWYADASFTRNDFTGYANERQGKDHPFNDGLRGFEWLPKQQYTGKALLKYTGKNLNVFYRFEYFDEQVSRYDSLVRENYNSSTQTSRPTASDEIFYSDRMFHHLNLNGKFLTQIDYDISLSHQQQSRDIERYNYRIYTGEKTDVETGEYQSRKGVYSRGTFTGFLDSQKYNLQLGYELSNINGFSSAIAGDFDGENIERRLESYDVFTTMELPLTSRFSLQPGLRTMFSSQFDTQLAYSLSAKYDFNKNYQLRAVVGSSPRNPNYDELFTYFVDINHDVQGNAVLNPERGFSTFLHLKKSFHLNKTGIRLAPKFSAWYLDVQDRIELTVVNQSPLAYQYNNIDIYRTHGASLTNSIAYKRLKLDMGLAYAGQSKVLHSDGDYNDDYLYALQANGNISYNIPKWNLTTSLYYKYNGPQYQFLLDTTGEDTQFIRAEQEGYSWMDASLKKSFFGESLQLTLGARNLFNLTRIANQTLTGGVHSTANNGLLIGYGRSYFLKILYNLNI